MSVSRLSRAWVSVRGTDSQALHPSGRASPMPMVRELQGLFERSGAMGEVEIYPHVHHGFAFPQRWCFDRQAAERHWERLIALYRRRLGG